MGEIRKKDYQNAKRIKKTNSKPQNFEKKHISHINFFF